MSLKTYDRDFDHVNDEMRPWPFILIDGCPDPGCDTLMPGSWVTHPKAGGRGMIIAVTVDQLSILWSEEPKALGDFTNITFPVVRRVQPALIANQLVSIQPMSLPTGLIFYHDYVYGAQSKSELDKKCSEGPLWSRTYWKVRRSLGCLKTKTSSLRYSLLSWVRSRFGPRLTSGATKLTQDELIKMTIERMAKGESHFGRLGRRP